MTQASVALGFFLSKNTTLITKPIFKTMMKSNTVSHIMSHSIIRSASIT